MQTINKGCNLYSSIILLFAALFSTMSCEKMVEVDVPGNRIAADNAYSSDITAIAVLNGIYSRMSNTGLDAAASIPNISFWAGLSSDELSLYSGSNAILTSYYRNNLSVNRGGSQFWVSAYSYIYSANAAIEGLTKSTSLTSEIKQQLTGEAKFIRAFFYFYLVNLYGDAPLALSTDYATNALLSRSSKEKVYQQIISDLKDAQELLADGYVREDARRLYAPSSAERVRPSRPAATALLARVYLYTGDFVNAESAATTLINNNAYFDLEPLSQVFKKNNKEAIWQLQPVSSPNVNTPEAYKFVLSYGASGVNFQHPVYLSNSLLTSFETDDQRKVNGNWINVFANSSGTYYYPYKYKDVSIGVGVQPTEYSTLLRLGEQYLIRAEARAWLGNNLNGAINDLDKIRGRAGLPLIITTNPSISQSALIEKILHERQVELFTELGHRWLDLKRTGKVDAVMTIETLKKGGAWNNFQQLYPIHLLDIQRNPNLKQNVGY